MRGGITRRTCALLLAVVGVIGALVAAGCGGSDGTRDRPDRSATLVLDFRRNAVHAGIELAVARDFDGAEGVQLRVREPPSSADAVGQLVSGRAQLAVVDVHDLALARAAGHDVVGVMAVVQRPLAAVIARPGMRRPRDLVGRRIGVSGAPKDDVVLRAIIEGDGGNGRTVIKDTIGFKAVSAVASGRVDAATGFWDLEGVALKARRRGSHVFRLDAYGAPPYPELVLATTREFLDDEPSVVRATVRALRRGYDEALADPQSAVSVLVDRGAGGRAVLQRQFDDLQGAFTAGARRFGDFDRAALERWSTWEAQEGLVDQPPDVGRAFVFGL